MVVVLALLGHLGDGRDRAIGAGRAGSALHDLGLHQAGRVGSIGAAGQDRHRLDAGQQALPFVHRHLDLGKAVGPAIDQLANLYGVVFLGPRDAAQRRELSTCHREADFGIAEHVGIVDNLRMAGQAADVLIGGAAGKLEIAAAPVFVAVARLGVAEHLRKVGRLRHVVDALE